MGVVFSSSSSHSSASELSSGARIQTRSGPIRGRHFHIPRPKYLGGDGSDRFVDVHAFLGIPYAQPPVGELRFQRPRPVEPWTDEKECIKFGPQCPYSLEVFFERFIMPVEMDEARCLSLNIFTPQLPELNKTKEPLAVMVFIHGGGFAIHSSAHYGDRTIAQNLCTRDVVVCSINYRTGPLGFACTGDSILPGNMGLWDQILALKWIRDNCHLFGGDPKRITIFGQSAGAASCDLLSLSPLCGADLFQQSISLAGTANCSFSLTPVAKLRSVTLQLAEFNGWQRDESASSEALSKSALDFLRTQPVENLTFGLNGKKGIRHTAMLLLTPCIDGELFPAPIEELRARAIPRPLMSGITQFEGLFFVTIAGYSRDRAGMLNFLRRGIADSDYGSKEEALKLRTLVVDHYLKGVDEKNKADVALAFVNMLGDLLINVGTLAQIRGAVNSNRPTYAYTFDYANPDGFGWLRFIMPFKAATHCYELRYLVGKGIFSKFHPNEDDQRMIDIFTHYYTNFAKTGNPNGEGLPQWDAVPKSNPYRHLSISLAPQMRDDLQGRRAAWFLPSGPLEKVASAALSQPDAVRLSPRL